MNKTFFKIGLGVLALASLAGPARGAVTEMKTLPGHVPTVVSQLTAVSPLSATNELHLAIGLPLRNREGLMSLLQQVYDPASPNYRHYLTPDEFTAQFGPTPEDYQTTLDFANANGLTVTHTHGTRTLVDVVGKVADVERAFHVKLMSYRHPVEARNFYAPDKEPTVDASLPVLSIQGLNNYVLPHPLLKKRPASLAQPSVGSGPQGGFMGQDFRNAYLPGSALNGANQTVGLFQFDGYFASDIQTYETLAGLPNVPLLNVLLDGFNGSPGFNNDEVCLDIEMSISMAPGLASVVVFEAGPFGNANDLLSSMVSSNQIKQFSASWGYQTDPTSDQFYLQFALQGQTFLNASGDGDAWLGPIPYGACEDPNITIIGGTTLTMNGVGVSYASEKAWNWGFAGGFGWNPDGYVGTSGGTSTDVPIPYYQVGINMVTNQGSTTYRNVPDVALTADNIFVVSSGGSEGIFGGTSCASPLWAGFMALVNQQAVANGQPTIGFLAPAVYALAKTANYAACFHDTTAGDNTWDQSPTKFFAVPGYDLCTGLGTPTGTNLINALAGASVVYTPVIPAPQQPWGNTLSTMVGTDPNGLWLLFLRDDKFNGFSGIDNNGWSINLTTANPVGFPGDNQLYVNTTVNGLPYGNATNVPAPLGTLWQMTLAVTNYGPSASTNVVVTDTLPPLGAFTLTSASSSIPGSAITVLGETLTWKVGNLANTAGGTLTLNLQSSNLLGFFTNSAVVTASTLDPNPDDDSIMVIANVAVTTPPVLSPIFISGPGGGFQLSVTNSVGATVVIEAATNLPTSSASAIWLPVYTNQSPFTYTNFDNTNFPSRFYRALIPQ